MWHCPSCQRAARFPDPRHIWPPGWKCDACGFIVPHRSEIPCLGPNLSDTPTSFNPRLFETLAKVEESNFWFVYRASLIVLSLGKYFPDARCLLEIGCGVGSVLLALRTAFPGFVLAGSELFPQGLEFARRRLGSSVLLLQMDARHIPASEEFDVIGAFDVIEHIKDDQDVLAQVYAALKRGGGVVIAVPQHPWLWSPADEAACHQRRYACGELEAKLRRAGFRILHSTSFNALLLPLMFASRMIMIARARFGRAVEPLSELQGAGPLNRAFSAVLKLEVALTASGLRWPLGGSRFVVAQKPRL
jgi:SAM-dependent methyltransferase